jgi:hypothetical protein
LYAHMNKGNFLKKTHCREDFEYSQHKEKF